MQNTPNKRKKRAQLAFIYSLMVISVVSIVAVLILVVQGYRYNQYDGKVEQGGLVQFDSKPSSATVSVDNITLANKTASKLTLTSGSHEVTISRSGYTTWKKSVTVKAGAVLWLNYARLLPEKLRVSTAANYQAAVTPLVSPDNKKISLLENAAQPVITLTSINTDSPQTSKITVPTSVYTTPSDGSTSEFALLSWNEGGRYLIMKHTYGSATEFLSIDTENVAQSRNITTSLGVEISSVRYSIADSNTAYILTASHELRRADLSGETLSGPLATNVAEFAIPDRDMVTYVTLADGSGTRTADYISSGLTTAKQIKSYDNAADTQLHVTSGTYYGERYVIVAHGETVDIYQGSLPSSDSSATLSLTKVSTFTVTGGVDYLGMSYDLDRFVYAAKGATVVTYDLELLKKSTVTLQGSLTRDVEWMDKYHMFATTGGNGYFYDFDGTNGQQFASNILDHPVALEDGGTYLYYFVQTDSGVSLRRIKMTTN